MNAPGVFFRDAVEADVHLDMNLAQLDRLSMCARAWEYPRRLVSPWSLVSPVVPDLAEQGKTVGAWIELAVNGIEFWDELVPWMRRATVLNKDRDSLGVLVQYLGNAVSHYENTAVEEEKERLASQIEESCRIVGLIGLVRFGNAGDGPRSG